MDGDDGAAVRRSRPKAASPVSSFFELAREALHLALEIGADVFAFARQFEQSVEVRGQAGDLAVLGDLLFQALAILHDLLAFFGLDQKSGAVICSSILASWVFCAGASKIAPHSVSLLAERNVLSFQFFEGHLVSSSVANCRVPEKSAFADVHRLRFAHLDCGAFGLVVVRYCGERRNSSKWQRSIGHNAPP